MRYSIKRLQIWIILLTLAPGINTFAQSSTSPQKTASNPQGVLVDEAFLKAAQTAIAERDLFKAQSLAKSEVIAAQAEQINALKGLLDLQRVISQEWKDAATIRRGVIAQDDKLILKFESEIVSLRNERDQAKGMQKWFAVGGFVAGIILAGYAKK